MNYRDYAGKYLIEGAPGTGKTSLLRAQVRAIAAHDAVFHRSADVVLCSMTKTAATEIVRDRPGEPPLPIEAWRVGTLHSLANRALDRPKIAEVHVASWNEENKGLALTPMSKGAIDDPDHDAAPAGAGDQLYTSLVLHRARMDPPESWPLPVREFERKWNEWKLDNELLDFTDLVDVALDTVATAPGAPRILIADEAQDLSALEVALVTKWGRAAAAFMLSGDPNQSIYGWRGAHPDLFYDPEVSGDHRRVLSQSYRIPAKVHRLSQRWIGKLSVPHVLDYKPREEEGAVSRIPCSWKRPEAILHASEKWLAEGKSVMVLASCSFMLDPFVACARKAGVPFANPWRVTRGDWNPVRESKSGGLAAVRALLGPGMTVRSWTVREFWTFASLLQSEEAWIRGCKTAFEARVGALEDDTDELLDDEEIQAVLRPEACEFLFSARADLHEGADPTAVLGWFSARVTGAKKRSIAYPCTMARKIGVAETVSGEKPRLYVGTIHSFKGGEADVVILIPDVSVNGSREWMSRGRARDAVIRTFYVGMTRCRERLVICDAASSASVDVLA